MSTRSIESYVTDICKYIDELHYKNMNTVYETLQKMRASFKSKHYLNYWKVLQCVGEVAADRLVYMVDNTLNASDQKCTNLQLLHVMELFNECLTTVAVIKRVNTHRRNVVAVVFSGLEQREYPHLVRKCLSVLYRLIIAGKVTLVTPYMKRGIVRHIYQNIKCRQASFGVNSLETVSYCAKILAALLQLADSPTRRTILKSNVINELDVYMVKLQKSKVECERMMEVWEFYDRVKLLSINDGLTSSLKQEDWNPKEKLAEELEQYEEVYIFCSSPTCRKQEMEKEKFLYCGSCRLSRYCCIGCQRQHWKQGHKQMCLRDN
ncbi:uncharacterized protein LOC125677301 [Ostrea edulis]|uniref:uncharacterized protein LOC125677301 n=1 Tax=Ostrea edulis TaxID=37623 RepID=UPI0024AF5930|nr:uncharacterized protein LOC125677301 [Ostrea edulis]